MMAPPLPLPPSVGLQGRDCHHEWDGLLGVDTGNECGVSGKRMGWMFGFEGFGICRKKHEARCVSQACHKSKGKQQEKKVTSTRTDEQVRKLLSAVLCLASEQDKVSSMRTDDKSHRQEQMSMGPSGPMRILTRTRSH